MKKILKMIGVILAYLGTYMIMQFIVGFFILTIFIFKQTFLKKDLNDFIVGIENMLSQNTSQVLIISIGLSLIAYTLMFLAENKNILIECKFKLLSIKEIAMVIFLGLGLDMIIDGILSFIPVDKWFPSHQEIINSIMGGNNYALTFFTVGILVPIFEEMLMRGLVFNELRKNMNINLAIIIQALIFGIYHGNMLQFIYASILGIFLGLAYVWTKSLWAPIIIHMLFNSSSLVLSKASINVNILLYTLIGVVIFFIGFKYLYKLTHAYKDEY